MQHKTVYILFFKFALHVSGVNHTHHQEYTTVTTASGTVPIFCAATSLRGQLACRLELKFCVILMMGVVDARNM